MLLPVNIIIIVVIGSMEKKRIQEPNKEAFAEYFGRIMLQEGKIKEEGIKSIEKYLSNSKEFMDALFPEIAKVQKR